MPTYELPVLFRIMAKPELKSALRRVADAIFETGGFLRKIDNLGLKQIPYKISSHNNVHREANYFIIHFESPPSSLAKLRDEYYLDVDIVKCHIFKKNEPEKVECTFEQELLPPAYRPEVKKLLEDGKKYQLKQDKYKFKYNTGLDYYPF